jgi:hypothetical protein
MGASGASPFFIGIGGEGSGRGPGRGIGITGRWRGGLGTLTAGGRASSGVTSFAENSCFFFSLAGGRKYIQVKIRTWIIIDMTKKILSRKSQGSLSA